MDWTHVLGIILGNSAFVIPLFLWNQSESRADIRHLEQKTFEMITSIKQEVWAIHAEMKDFHGRLCAIEERNKK